MTPGNGQTHVRAAAGGVIWLQHVSLKDVRVNTIVTVLGRKLVTTQSMNMSRHRIMQAAGGCARCDAGVGLCP